MVTFNISGVHFCFQLSLNSNRDSGVTSSCMLFLQRRGLTVLFCPHHQSAAPLHWDTTASVIAGGVGVPFQARLALGVVLAAPDDQQHGQDVHMTVSVHTKEYVQQIEKRQSKRASRTRRFLVRLFQVKRKPRSLLLFNVFSKLCKRPPTNHPPSTYQESY